MGGESCWGGMLWTGATHPAEPAWPPGVQAPVMQQPQGTGGDPLGGSSGVRSLQGPWHRTIEMECTENMQLEW